MSNLTGEDAELLGFVYACPVGLAEMTGAGTIGMINPKAMQLLMPLARVSSMNFFEIMDAYAPDPRNLVEAWSLPQGLICEDHRILIHSEKAGQANLRVYACTLVKLSADRFMITLKDVSKQAKQEQKLKEAETWFSSLLDDTHDFGIISLDAEGRIESVNESFIQRTGYNQEEVVGQTLDIFAAVEGALEALGAEQQIFLASREGWYLHEAWQKHKDGTASWWQRLIAVRNEEQGSLQRVISGYTVILREGPQRSIDIHKLKQMLTRDHLTATYNRMHFFETAEKECVRSKRYQNSLALIAMDIDYFKRVNDLQGHAVGDKILKAVAQRCMSLLRPSDLIGRIGGEEFAILLPLTTLAGAVQLAERLRIAVAEKPIFSLEITGSFGCAALHAASCTLTEMMAAADSALYRAKGAGRNCVVSEPGS